jgi:N-acetylglucosamine kinase
VDAPQDGALIREQVESLNITRQVCVVNDTEIALIGGVGGERGVVVVAGTGSGAFGCDGEGHKAGAGGWGWILGDEGSAFDIGQRGLRTVVRALEGRDETTALTEALMQRWNLADMDELVASLRARSWSRGDVASLAEWVTKAAHAGDAAARRIVTRAGEELGLLGTVVIRQLRMSGEFGVVLTGGVFRAGDLISEPLRRRIHAVAPDARLMPPIHPPALGAVFMAWRKLGLPLDRERMERAHAMFRAKRKA